MKLYQNSHKIIIYARLGQLSSLHHDAIIVITELRFLSSPYYFSVWSFCHLDYYRDVIFPWNI